MGLVLFGGLAAKSTAEIKFGHEAPPPEFPEFNWIQFPSSIAGLAPMHRDQLVSCNDGIYILSGCAGPFEIDGRDRRRLWAMHLDVDIARVECWRRL